MEEIDAEVFLQLETAARHLSDVIVRIQQSIHAAMERLDPQFQTVVQMLAICNLAIDSDDSEDYASQVFDIWVDCHAAGFAARYGSDWRERLETAAKRAYGPDWKRNLVARHDHQQRE